MATPIERGASLGRELRLADPERRLQELARAAADDARIVAIYEGARSLP